MDQPPGKRPPWQTCLDFDAQAADHYLDYFNPTLLEMIEAPPRKLLDLGCAAGMFGAKVKERWPQASVVGVEAGKAASAKAATRLDRVINTRLEALDLAAEGFAPGEFDCLVAADVLEHIVNPWQLLVDVRPFLSADALVMLSIPNVRNLGLLTDLVGGGQWAYGERGLLDITHLRFFTLSTINQMLQETGYRVESLKVNIGRNLAGFWEQAKGQPTVNVRFGRFTLENVTREELNEFCAEQFFLRCRLA